MVWHERRDFLKVCGVLLAGCGIGYNFLANRSLSRRLDGLEAALHRHADELREEIERLKCLREKDLARKSEITAMRHKIYNGLEQHVHMSDAVIKYTVSAKDEKEIRKSIPQFSNPVMRVMGGRGIVLGGKYITCAHVVGEMRPFFRGRYPLVFQDREISVAGMRIDMNEELYDINRDIARYALPAGLNLPDFPCKPSSSVEAGDHVYLIGEPQFCGGRVRDGKVSSKDFVWYRKLPSGRQMFTDNDRFCTDIIAFSGDSSSPLVNDNFEVVAMMGSVHPITRYYFKGYNTHILGGPGNGVKIDRFLQ